MIDLLLVVLIWLALALVLGTAVGLVLYRLGRPRPPEPLWGEVIADLGASDGLPACATLPPGAPESCFRCGAITECGAIVHVGHPATGRLFEAVLCRDCYEMFWRDQAAFRGLFLRRAVEEFGDHE